MNRQTALQILLVDDEDIVHQTIGDFLQESGHKVESAFDGEAALWWIEAEECDLALIDVRLADMDGLDLLASVQENYPDIAVVIITGHGSMETAIRALRLGVADFLPKPVKLLDLDAVLEKAVRLRDLRRDRSRLQETIRTMRSADELREGKGTFIGASAAAVRVRQQIQQAVQAVCETILIAGETGTGKEVVAREIHAQYGEDDKPFIAVSCPALPGSLVESELFGHVRGAFTGAAGDRVGYFELADGVALSIRGGRFIRRSPSQIAAGSRNALGAPGGGAREKWVDVQVIGATNRPLEDMVAAGGFRADLLYRLNAYVIELPPLRQRRDDIRPLATHFAALYAGRRGLSLPVFSSQAQDLLLAYNYPGNARELRNLVDRAVMLCGAGQILPDHLNLPQSRDERATHRAAATDERSAILSALEEARWNRRQAAKALGMPYSTLRYKIDKFGLD